MNRIARNWRVVLAGVAAGSAAVLGFTGASASAEPVLPAPPGPAPATVTQTVTVSPEAEPLAQPTPAAQGSPTAAATPDSAAAPAAPAAQALPPATSGTIGEFLKERGVEMQPQEAAGFTALNIVLPVPTGWTVVPDPNVPDAFSVIADRKGGDGLYTSNAQLLVYKLVGDVNPREAISHGYVDSQKLFAWQSTAASMADFGGFPSSKIDGTYRDGDLTLNTSRRYVIAQSGSDQYLLSLSVTTSASQAVATGNATDGILNGFRVSVPGLSTKAPSAPSGPSAPSISPAPPVVPQAAAPASDPTAALPAL